jgi:hypothetical protein
VRKQILEAKDRGTQVAFLFQGGVWKFIPVSFGLLLSSFFRTPFAGKQALELEPIASIVKIASFLMIYGEGGTPRSCPWDVIFD